MYLRRENTTSGLTGFVRLGGTLLVTKPAGLGFGSFESATRWKGFQIGHGQDGMLRER